MQQSDSVIRNAVEELLRSSTRVDEKEVRVSVRDALVVLEGAVDSAIEKRHARQLAEDVPGVKGVSDRMTVKNFRPVPDDQLVESVRIALQRDAYVDDEEIEVYASNGEVRLDGSVATYHMKKAAEDVTWWNEGVTNVENLLLVADEEFVDISPGEVVDA
jgi:hyperosmotically inducible periplasmic protein